MKMHEQLIILLKTVWKSENKELRYSRIGSKVFDMFEFASQSIACEFAELQELWDVPSLVAGP